MTSKLITSIEAREVSDAFLLTLYGRGVCEKWKKLKDEMGFGLEREFVTWLIDVAYEHRQCNSMKERQDSINAQESYEEYGGTHGNQAVAQNITHAQYNVAGEEYNVNQATTYAAPSASGQYQAQGHISGNYHVVANNRSSHPGPTQHPLSEQNIKQYNNIQASHNQNHKGQVYPKGEFQALMLSDLPATSASSSSIKFEEEDIEVISVLSHTKVDFEAPCSTPTQRSREKSSGSRSSSRKRPLQENGPEGEETSGEGAEGGDGKLRFRCGHCQYSSARKDNLTRHERVVHHRLKHIECPQCDYTCSQKQALQSHIVRKHTLGGEMSADIHTEADDQQAGDAPPVDGGRESHDAPEEQQLQ